MTSRTFSFIAADSLVEAFAALTGDRNALHMDSQKARSYDYRKRVVHGMLPVSALWAFPEVAGGHIIKMSGRFLYPVYVNDTLTLELLPRARGFSYKVYSSSMRTPVTDGTIELGPAARSKLQAGGSSKSLVPQDLGENTFDLTDLAKHQGEQLSFCAEPKAMQDWIKTLTAQDPKIALKSAGTSADMAAVMMCSTMVGMRLPGQRATFLNFVLDFTQPLKWRTPYRLSARVEHISSATQIITESVAIAGHMTGKLWVKIQERSRPLPSTQELRGPTADASLAGKVVWITGASRGIGATAARLFAARGAKVVVNYLTSQSQAMEVVKDIEGQGGQAVAIKADVSQPQDVRDLVAQVSRQWGTVDVLVNNAVTDYVSIPFSALNWDRVQQDIDVIVKGAFLCSQEVLPSMVQKKQGRIINVVTMATEIPPVGHAKYVMAKSALIGLTRSLAVEYAGHQILVNMVMPSMVETDLTKGIPAAVRERMRGTNPLGRHATTVDVAQAIVSLAGDQFSFTTGQKFFVTGGLPPFI